MMMMTGGDDPIFQPIQRYWSYDTQAGTIWSARTRGYQCSGGPQSQWNTQGLNTVDAPNCLGTGPGVWASANNYGNNQAEGVYSNGFLGTQDPTWCPMQPECLNSFSYPWFPNVASPDRGNWPGQTFVPPAPGFIMYRLPAFTISNRTCTPSPFVNATVYPPNVGRTPYVSWTTAANLVPTQCGDDMTQSIVDLIGPGYYTAPLGAGATATLSLGPDNNTVTCAYTLGSPVPFGMNVVNVTVVVTDGPVFASDDPLYTGNPSSPYWQAGFLNVSTTMAATGSGSVLLSQALNSSVARSYTRVVDCVVDGVNNQTGLPFTLKAAQPYVVETLGQGWLPYNYPMPGNYVPSRR